MEVLVIVDHWPLAPGEMFRDLSGVWYVRCPNCGVISNSNTIDRYFECSECGTIEEVRQNDGIFEKLPQICSLYGGDSMLVCPDCGTPLERRYHFIGDHKLPYWVCPKCHDLNITLESTDLDTMEKHKWAYKDGYYELVEKEEPR